MEEVLIAMWFLSLREEGAGGRTLVFVTHIGVYV